MEGILNLIKEMQLPLVMDSPMCGGGNCEFYGIIQQAKRADVDIAFRNHIELRSNVCNFALTSLSPNILQLRVKYSELYGDLAWEELLEKGEWIHGPVLPVAALFLNHHINVISLRCNNKNA